MDKERSLRYTVIPLREESGLRRWLVESPGGRSSNVIEECEGGGVYLYCPCSGVDAACTHKDAVHTFVAQGASIVVNA